jgi:hypothetical protein
MLKLNVLNSGRFGLSESIGRGLLDQTNPLLKI